GRREVFRRCLEAARHTALTIVFTGRPARDRQPRRGGGRPDQRRGAPFPLATAAISPLRAKAESLKSGEFSPLWSGQNASGCKEVPAVQLTRELAAVGPER